MLGIDDLMAEIILALGAALAAGMGLALFGPALRERYGLPGGASGARGPAGRDERLAGAAKGRAVFLFCVGLVMAVWGLATIVVG